MCQLCRPLSRRDFCNGALFLPLALPPRGHGIVEPDLLLAPSGGRRVAVTLDACPGRFDLRVANMLVEKQIPATIFVTATWMRWNKAGLAFLLAHPDVFTLENHGAKHLPPILGSTPVYDLAPAGTLKAIRQEVLDGASAIADATGRRPSWYRGAAGLYSPESIPFIEALGFKIAGYSLNSDEGASLPAASVARRLEAAKDGDVIEGHINQPYRASGAGIAEGLAALQGTGARFARLDEAA